MKLKDCSSKKYEKQQSMAFSKNTSEMKNLEFREFGSWLALVGKIILAAFEVTAHYIHQAIKKGISRVGVEAPSTRIN